MICTSCGNQILHTPGPVCLVCQETGRDSGRAIEAHARGLAAAMDAVYKAMSDLVIMSREEQDAILNVAEAQQMLRHRIRNPEHNRERPDWEEDDREERERNTCGLCCDTGLIMGKHCPECWSED